MDYKTLSIAGSLLLVNFIWLLTITVWVRGFMRKGKELFSKDRKGDIYELANNFLVKSRKIEEENGKILSKMEDLVKLFKNSFQKIGIVRYNPFKDVGGDLSFSVALLDFNDNGVVITNIHNREGDRLYTKPIKKGTSEHNLSEEEKEAIKKAVK